MAVNIGPKIGIDGEADYRKAINNIIQQQKTLGAEMQKTTALFSKDADAKKKNAAQVEILNKQIANQKERISQLSMMYDESVKKTGENSTASLKWKEALVQAEAELANLESKLKSVDKNGFQIFGASIEAAGKKVKKLGEDVSKVGETLSKNVTAPIMAVGAASIAAAKDVDNGLDTIITKTGATGEQLEDMQKRMENIATSIPISFETAGAAIGEVNTRFGVTGQELEDLSAHFIKFAELNGTDVSSSIDSVQKMMSAFGLETKDAGAVLDTLNKVGQDTGISVTKLADSLVTNGSALRELNLNAADSAVLLGNLEKSGIDTSVVMTGLSKVQQKAAKDGKDMSAVLETAFSSSANAVEIFGAKAGPKLYEAMQSGILTMDMFSGGLVTLEDNLGSVNDTFEATLDPWDQWETTLNQLKITGAELGTTLLTMLQPVLDQVSQGVKGLSDYLNTLDEDQKKQIITIAGVAAAAGPVLAIVGKGITFVGSLISVGGTLISGIGTIVGILGGPLTLAIAGAVAAGVLLYKNWDKVKEFAANTAETVRAKFDEMKTNVTNIFEGVKTSITTKISDAKTNAENLFEAIKNGAAERSDAMKASVSNIFESTKTGIAEKVSAAKAAVVSTFDAIKQNTVDRAGAMQTALSNIFESTKAGIISKVTTTKENAVNLFESMKASVTERSEAMRASVTNIYEATKQSIAEKVTAMRANVANAFDTIKQSMVDRVEAARTTVMNIFESIRSGIADKINAARNAVQTAVDRIKSIMNFSWSLPHLKLPHISVSGSFSLMPPSVPHFSISWYKKAYENAVMFSSPTVIPTAAGLKGFGDGNGGEIVIGQRTLLDTFTAAVERAHGSNQITINMTVNNANPDIDVRELADLVSEEINEKVNSLREVYA